MNNIILFTKLKYNIEFHLTIQYYLTILFIYYTVCNYGNIYTLIYQILKIWV